MNKLSEKEELLKEFIKLIYGYFVVGKTEEETVALLTPIFQQEKNLPVETVSAFIRKAHKRLASTQQV